MSAPPFQGIQMHSLPTVASGHSHASEVLDSFTNTNTSIMNKAKVNTFAKFNQFQIQDSKLTSVKGGSSDSSDSNDNVITVDVIDV